MFKMVTGGNGRVVFCGKITRAKEGALEIQGTDWNYEAKEEIETLVQMKVAPEMMPISQKVEIGEKIITTLMPDRKKPNFGVAEEIAQKGSAVVITNDKGNEKIVLIGTVRSKKWNEKHNMLTISFLNIKDVDGGYIGYESNYQDREGKDCTSYWLNVSYFNTDKFKNIYNATKADKNIQVGDVVAMVISIKQSQYNGKPYINYNGNKFNLISKQNNNSAQKNSTPEIEEHAKSAPPIQETAVSDEGFVYERDGFEDIGDDYMSIFD